MTAICPYCDSKNSKTSGEPDVIHRHGRYRRKSDSRYIERFYCIRCERTFSRSTDHPCFGQRRRTLNSPIYRLIVSGMSMRRIAWHLRTSRSTVARKLLFLGAWTKKMTSSELRKYVLTEAIEFDDLETFEHSKCKPISITLAVASGARKILGFRAARMPAKGPLAAIAFKRYGKRIDERKEKREDLFSELADRFGYCHLLKSDQNPHYPPTVNRHFPGVQHLTFKGRRGCVVGQGELKRGGFDPLFSLNHTAAMFRANINRLFRRTWCTTKKIECLRAHIAIYVHFHNTVLT